jgi:anti-sigma factor RsiW
MNSPISNADLHAYADGQLDPNKLTLVEAWLANHPEHREEINEWRIQSAQLHNAFDAVLNEPLPSRLLPKAKPDTVFNIQWMTSGATLLVGVMAGFYLHNIPGLVSDDAVAVQSLPQMAAMAHVVYTPEVRHPVEVGVDQEAHLVQWLSKRLGSKLTPPKLDDIGYKLMGGRLLPGDKGSVAQFMYENNSLQRLTLYVRPNAKDDAAAGFHYAREGNLDVFYWVNGQFGYALSGDIGRNQMLVVAKEVYKEFESNPTY